MNFHLLVTDYRYITGVIEIVVIVFKEITKAVDTGIAFVALRYTCRRHSVLFPNETMKQSCQPLQVRSYFCSEPNTNKDVSLRFIPFKSKMKIMFFDDRCMHLA